MWTNSTLLARHLATEYACACHHGDFHVHLDMERLLQPVDFLEHPANLHAASRAAHVPGQHRNIELWRPLCHVDSLVNPHLWFLPDIPALVDGRNQHNGHER